MGSPSDRKSAIGSRTQDARRAVLRWKTGSRVMAPWIAIVVMTLGYPATFPSVTAQEDLIVDLGTLPGDDYSTALAINETGAVVGWSGLDFGFQGKRAFLWVNGTMTDLGSLGGTQGTWAMDINEAGQVVGSSHNATNYERPFLWENGLMTELDVGAVEGGATAINDAGQIVGHRLTATDDPNDPYGYRAFLWQDGVVVDLGSLPGFRDSYATGINDAGQVVGYVRDPEINGPVHAFLWDSGLMRDLGSLPGDPLSQATGINEAGQVVGWSGDFGRSRAFLWEADSMRPLGDPAANATAYGINGVAQVVGENGTAVVWHDGKELGLGSLVPGQPSVAYDVNDAGAAAGQGDLGSGVAHAVLWIQVVPVHDVAVTASAVNPYPTVGEIVLIDVVGMNLGNRPETFDVSVSVDPYFFGTAMVAVVAGSSTSVRFEWNTTGIPPGTYSLNATASPVPGETNLADNVFRNEGAIVLFLRLEALPSASASVTDVGLPILFTCDKTDRAAPYGPYAYLWSFGDGNQSAGERVSHAYGSPRTYTATCTVTEDGENASASITVRVLALPTVQGTADRSAASPGTLIRFSATAIGGSGRYTFHWAFGDGTSVTGANVSHAYGMPGEYTAIVSAVDSFGGRSPDPFTIRILISVITTSTSISPGERVTGELITFTATSEGGAGGPYRYSWSFGDGARTEGASVTHRYQDPGTYVPRLTVTDAAGASRAFDLPAITIRSPPSSPAAAFSMDVDSTKIILGILVVAGVAGAVLSVRRHKPPVR